MDVELRNRIYAWFVEYGRAPAAEDVGADDAALRRLQTSFGQLSYTLDASAASVRASIDLPSGFAGPLRLRLRLPAGQRLGAVTVNGLPTTRFLGPETIDLTGATGHVDVVARRLP